jgi:hypothetical protein
VINPHRYRLGEIVHYTPPGIAPGSKAGDYSIERVLPPDDSDNQYEIVCVADGQRRVVHERDIADSRPLAESVATNGSDSQ